MINPTLAAIAAPIHGTRVGVVYMGVATTRKMKTGAAARIAPTTPARSRVVKSLFGQGIGAV